MSKDKLIYKDDGTVDYNSGAFYKDTRFNGKLVRLEDIIDEVYERALKTIDDSLYELLDDKDDDEFYMDYKEAFPLIVEKLQKFHDLDD
jgi:Tfp pilus assembly ATPase PilU